MGKNRCRGPLVLLGQDALAVGRVPLKSLRVRILLPTRPDDADALCRADAETASDCPLSISSRRQVQPAKRILIQSTIL